MRLADPYTLFLLAAVPLAVWALFFREKERTGHLVYSSLVSLRDLDRGLIHRLWPLPKLLRIAALALLVVALARPQSAGGPTEVQTHGIDIVITLDVSTSMRAADFQPRDRLHVAKEVIADFVRSRVSDRLGLVVFAAEAYTQCPLTLDYSVIHTILKSVRTGVVEDGTAIGNALALSINRLRDSEAKSKVVILLTDGENNRGHISPVQAAEFAREFGIKVFPILVGRGGEVPYPAGTDFFGQPQYRKVEIPVNPELLEEIARVTEGHSFVATDRRELEGNFREIIDALEKSRLPEAGGYTVYAELFPRWLIPALLLMAFDLLLTTTRFRRLP